MKFEELALSAETMRAIQTMGFENATEIQSKSIPLIMTGKDVIGRSHTGTGKTMAFGVPAIEMLDHSMKKTQVLVLAPTRELAMQAAEEIRKLTLYKESVKVAAVYGGQPISYQIPILRQGAQIVIGTPGRIMDHIERKTLKLENIKMVILDEADEMLNMGFREDIEKILSFMPAERQTILFSATMPKLIMDLTNRFQKSPVLVEVGDNKSKTMDTIAQYYLDVPMGRKMDALNLLIHTHEPKLSIIFCNTKKMVDELCTYLNEHGFKAAGLHGDMKQEARTRVMAAFKSGKINILIATDVAARGIDVNDVDTVYNFDIPQDFEYYVHRIGRTGRAGRSGGAYTLISGRKQFYGIRDIEYYTKAKITKIELPKSEEIIAKKRFNLVEEVRAIIESADSAFDSTEIVKALEEMGYDAEKIAASLLSMLLRRSVIKVPKIVAVKSTGYEASDRRAPTNNSRKTDTRGSSGSKEGYVKVRISAGREENIAANHIVSAVSQYSGLNGKILGKINIYGTYSIVEVPEANAAQVIEKVSGNTINSKVVDLRIYKDDNNNSSRSYSGNRSNNNRSNNNRDRNRR